MTEEIDKRNLLSYLKLLFSNPQVFFNQEHRYSIRGYPLKFALFFLAISSSAVWLGGSELIDDLVSGWASLILMSIFIISSTVANVAIFLVFGLLISWLSNLSGLDSNRGEIISFFYYSTPVYLVFVLTAAIIIGGDSISLPEILLSLILIYWLYFFSKAVKTLYPDLKRRHLLTAASIIPLFLNTIITIILLALVPLVLGSLM